MQKSGEFEEIEKLMVSVYSQLSVIYCQNLKQQRHTKKYIYEKHNKN